MIRECFTRKVLLSGLPLIDVIRIRKAAEMLLTAHLSCGLHATLEDCLFIILRVLMSRKENYNV